MKRRRATVVHGLALAVCACACSANGGSGTQPGPDGGSDSASPIDAHVQADSGQHLPKPDGGASKPDGGTPMDAGTGSDGGGLRAGWLYTVGNGIVVADGPDTSHPWFGRGVNIDDIFLCGYDDTLWMTSPGTTLETIVSGLVSGWKPSFVRISLGMDSNPTVVSWLTDPAQYATPMTSVINAIGANPGVYVLVTLRSDASMIGQDEVDGDPEATGLPSDSTTTPDATTFPMGTDPVYVALVDAFGSNAWVMFGLTNEPGGNKLTDATISAAMSHAVGVIRAEEDRLHLPHHIVSVQGNSWTSDISFYSTTPLAYDNVVYEVHGYPPTPSMYTYSNIPVIIGEYGTLTSSTAATLYADLESKGIPNLAWDFEPYSDCAPDLLNVTDNASTLTPTAWGSIVQGYLTTPP
jgi:cellulase (glycosyl hydrolase family 5)